MKANYNVTGEDRKQMVAIISREAGTQAVYTRMPECAYVIDNMKVTKTGELLWDERTDEDLIEKITAALTEAGFTAQAEAEAEEAEETGGTDGADGADSTDIETTEIPPIEGLVFSFPRTDFTELALAKLKALITSKQTLIKKALQADNTEIEIDNEKVSFPWWDEVGTPEQIAAYGEFLSALVKMAKESRRVSSKERETESEKYTFRTFLLRLGFNGPEHKKIRAILMEHLTGYAAFKNQADADAFFARQKAKKAAQEAAAEKTAEAGEPADADEEEADDEISE